MRYKLFSTGSLKPTGWLRRQLEIQADGLSGNLDKIWPDVRDSRWIGGEREGWERVPYWLDGFIPLAYLLEDQDKIERAKKYVNAILDGQKADGWICPCEDGERHDYDMWALYLIDKVLMLYYDCSGDERIPMAVYSSLKNLAEHIEVYPVFNWGHSRWFECLIPIYALYRIYPEEWLLDLAKKLKEQGMDYEDNYAGGDEWKFRDPIKEWRFDTHVVNQGMAIKAGALESLLNDVDLPFDEREADDSFSDYMLSQLFKYHGTVAGHFTGDECLAGDSPIHGTELCGVVEAMYSYEVLYQLTGKPVWIDRLEKLAFNALPATVSPDMWTHQYDQQTNQIACVPLKKSCFNTNGEQAHIFGLEPNFGCCTANFNQGFPKLALSAFYKTENGIAVGAILPSRVEFTVGGKCVSVESDTMYPFGNTVNYLVDAEDGAEFSLSLRIPSCAVSATVNGEAAEPGEVVTLSRVWSGRSVVTLDMEFDVSVVSRPRELFAIERGPLVYALKIEEKWSKVEYDANGVERKFPYCDYEIRPASEWQYALVKGEISVSETGCVSDVPFSPDSAPISLSVPVVPINWGYAEEYGLVARETPISVSPVGEARYVEFIPYGCTDLRLTELPFAE